MDGVSSWFLLGLTGIEGSESGVGSIVEFTGIGRENIGIRHHQDPSSLRYMMSFALERVFIESEMEFAELLVKGQSFMLHQIRKMVGLMVAVVRGNTDMGMIEKAFSKDKVMIPTAPGLGLMLDKVHYERYDAKFKDSHESLTWDSEEEAVERFKREQIFPSMIKGEIEGSSMAIWLEKIKQHSYEPNDEVNEVNEVDDKSKGNDNGDEKKENEEISNINDRSEVIDDGAEKTKIDVAEESDISKVNECVSKSDEYKS